MRTRFMAFPVLLLAMMGMANMLIGQDDKEGGDELPDFKTIKAEFDQAYSKYRADMRSEKDAEKRAELVESMPKMDQYVDRIFQLAEAPNEDSAAEALAWLIVGPPGVQDADVKQKALEMLLENHIDSEPVGTIASSLIRQGTSKLTESTLRKIIESSPVKEVRGKTSYSLYSYLSQIQRTVENKVTMERALGRLSDVDKEYLESKTPESVSSEIDEILDSISANYSDVILRGKLTLGDKMEGIIFEKERLQIGMKAPDIEGEDIDGKEFKLSEYEGKVVVIDFWGDW